MTITAATSLSGALVTSPIRVGTLHLDHRLVVPPHSGGAGSLLGTPEQFELLAAYWTAKVRGGMQWVGGGPQFVGNPMIPGFEPTGVGAMGPGIFRHRLYPERLGELASRVHGEGGYLSAQMVLQGGMPSAPSATLSGYFDHRIPHVLDLDEIAWLVAEYGDSAAIAVDAGVDAIELHANHDDLLQWFLSPLTNRRDDGYGGDLEGRRRFLREVVERIRERVGRPVTLGLRLCLDEMIEGGYGLEELQRVMAAFTAEGTVDYFSLDVGNNWGRVTYIQVGSYAEGEWAALCGQARSATDLPVVYVGRVSRAETVDEILAAGHADLVGTARATVADAEFAAKVLSGRRDEIRPCMGFNECIDRKLVEGLGFACASNPVAGRETRPAAPRVASSKVLVVGGGPAGLELAGLAAERGHTVEVWEAQDALGGQLAVAARARSNAHYERWIEFQGRRLERAGVTVRTGTRATAENVLAGDFDVVAIATGAAPRLPDARGLDADHVMTAAEVLTGRRTVSGHVLVVSEDDRAAPLAVADHLAAEGHRVTLIHRTPAPSPLVGKYTVGALLARLDEAGVEMVPMTRLVAVESDGVRLAHVYSDREHVMDGIDTVVLACGAISDPALYLELKGRHPRLHLLGDAFAPRRVAFATHQALEVADLIGAAL